MNETIRIVFFNLRLRLYILRIIVLSALVATIGNISIHYTYLSTFLDGWTALFAFITVHHILVTRPLKFFPAVLDLILAIGEAIGIGVYTKHSDILFIYPWAPEVIVYYTVATYTLLVCLWLLTIFRLASVIQSYGKILLSSLDMFEGLSPHTEDRPTISTLFVGRTFWKEHFEGEARIVRILRGLLGLGIIVLLFFYSMLHLVYDPIRETSLNPVHEYRVTIPPIDYKIDPMIWNIVIGPITIFDVPTQDIIISQQDILNSQQDIIDSISVIPLGRPDPGPNTTYKPCETIQQSQNATDGSISAQITYQCYGQTLTSDGSFAQVIPDGVLITVNYTRIPQPNYGVQALNVVVGLFNESSVGFDILSKSASLNVVQGVNLIAAINPNIREVFVNPGVAAFGLYQTTKPIWIGMVTSIYHDPSPNITRDPAVSTLRLYLQSPNPTELRIMSDQRENSVLAGFSALSGLWTSLCGLFALMFGGSLLNYLYGSKNISVLGAAHSFNHTRLREEFQKKYPGIKEEDDGILALLRDHIIDLSFLKGPSSSPTDPDVEKGHTGTDSSNPVAKTRKRRSDATEHSESDTVEKDSLLVDSQFAPTSTYGVNDASYKTLSPLRKQPSV